MKLDELGNADNLVTEYNDNHPSTLSFSPIEARRGPGRPRKHAVQASEQQTDKVAPHVDTAKRRPGRPRKTLAIEAPTNDVPADPPINTPADPPVSMSVVDQPVSMSTESPVGTPVESPVLPTPRLTIEAPPVSSGD